MKSTYNKWKRCSHICLLTFLLKRGRGLVGVSVPLKVDWSVPALKFYQSVSATVWCLVWWTWWTCYSSVLVMEEFVQSLASAFFVFLLYTVCFIHINFMVLYLYEWNTWAALLIKSCYVQGYVVAYSLMYSWSHPHSSLQRTLKWSNLTHVTITWSSLLWLISINSRTLWSQHPSTMHTLIFKDPGTYWFPPVIIRYLCPL